MLLFFEGMFTPLNTPLLFRLGVWLFALVAPEIATSVAENSPLVARTLGGIYQRKGDMFAKAGKTKEAVEQYQRGLRVFQKQLLKLSAKDPEREIAQYNVAVVYMKLADVDYQQGNRSGARDRYQEALRIRRSLAEARLNSPELQNHASLLRAVAASCTSLGNLSLNEGDLARARDHFREAHVIREKLVGGPEDISGRHELAVSCAGLAEICLRLNDRPATRKYYSDLLKVMQDLTATYPQNLEFKTDLASCYERSGNLHLCWRADLQRAFDDYRHAQEIRQTLLQNEPDSAELQVDLAASTYQLGTASLWLGRKAESDKYYQESLKMREKLFSHSATNTHRMTDLMLSLARCGQHGKAAKIAEAICKATSSDPAFLFSAACGYALSIPAVANGKEKLTSKERKLQQSYRDKAIDTVRQAIEKGFDDPVTLETDPDLAPVQNDPHFKELLKKLRKQ